MHFRYLPDFRAYLTYFQAHLPCSKSVERTDTEGAAALSQAVLEQLALWLLLQGPR